MDNEDIKTSPQELKQPRADDTITLGASQFEVARLAGFASLSAELAGLLNEHFEERSLAEGEYLIRQGDVADSLYLITEGKVRICSHDEAGSELTVCESGPGEFLGEMSLLTGQPRTADVVVIEPVRALALPARKVYELSESHPELTDFMSNLIASRLGLREIDALAGKQLGGYRVVRRLGRGGMSVVYEAIAPNRTRVALKMLSHKLVNNTGALANFEREFKLLTSFECEHILLNHGKFSAFYSHFIVLEFCDGQSLAERIDATGAIELGVACRMLLDVCNAVEYAHERTVLHRDIKPANILISKAGKVKLTDFGLAIPVGEMRPDELVAGTWRFMAPEVRVGDLASRQSDYFALGITALELLAGKSIEYRMDETAESYCPGIPRDLGEEIDRLIAPDVTNRPTSLTDFIAALDRHATQSRIDQAQRLPGAPPRGQLHEDTTREME